MAHYPKEYETVKKLDDGTKVILRSIKSEDEMLWQEMFKNFSDKSIWNRFFNVIKETPHKFRIRFCNIDYKREIAIIALIQQPEKKMLGVVRFTFDPNMKSGELAFIVADPWQNLGLGTRMVEYIIQICKNQNVEVIYSFMLPNNYGGIRFLKKLGFSLKYLDNEVKGVFKLV
jgi:acetyltransferase